jgi:hypothetical protein
MIDWRILTNGNESSVDCRSIRTGYFDHLNSTPSHLVDRIPGIRPYPRMGQEYVAYSENPALLASVVHRCLTHEQTSKSAPCQRRSTEVGAAENHLERTSWRRRHEAAFTCLSSVRSSFAGELRTSIRHTEVASVDVTDVPKTACRCKQQHAGLRFKSRPPGYLSQEALCPTG